MREVIFKNLTSGDRTKRDLYISETIENNGVKTIIQRHSVYRIGSHNKIKTPKELVELQSKGSVEYDKRHVFIFKKRDTKLKKDSFICDIVGKFYAIVKDELYSIAFKHSFEIDFLSVAKK